jgi:hypothetical protein
MCDKLSMIVQYAMFSFSFGIGNLLPAYLSPLSLSLSLSSLFRLMSPFVQTYLPQSIGAN